MLRDDGRDQAPITGRLCAPTDIHTCELSGGNPFEYLAALQRHAAAVTAAPGEWMPWNYRDRLDGAATG